MSTMQRPTKVRLGVRTYQIKYLQDEEWVEQGHDESQRGVCNNILGVIFIRKTVGEWVMDEDGLRETVFHEVMHAVASCSMTWNSWDIVRKRVRDDYDSVEEFIVGGWSPTMLAMLRDNPDLRKWLMA
jgi:hypothetical protein